MDKIISDALRVPEAVKVREDDGYSSKGARILGKAGELIGAAAVAVGAFLGALDHYMGEDEYTVVYLGVGIGGLCLMLLIPWLAKKIGKKEKTVK